MMSKHNRFFSGVSKHFLIKTVAKDMGATGRDEALVAGSVVVVVVTAADSHIWAYIWGGGGYLAMVATESA